MIMRTIQSWFLVVTILFGIPNLFAQTQLPIRIRGAITNSDGQELQVMTREGKELKVNVTDETKINVLTLLSLSNIKQGSFVGVTAFQTGPGTPLQAREVHIFPESLRGTGEGHYDWDLEPGSSMTNANVDAIVTSNNGKELTLSYKGGIQNIFVPEGVPIVTFKPADKTLLATGAQVFIMAKKGADGNLVALHIQVGKDGLKPPM